MRRTLILTVAALTLAGAVWTGTALATNPHWVVDPYCSQTDANTLDCSGKAAGLGGLPVFVVVKADAGCTNQDGTHVIPGKSTTVSGPFSSDGGNFTFGAENNKGENQVSAHGPGNCPGAAQQPFISTTNVTLSIYECSSGSPTFNKKGQQTNSSCQLRLGPTPVTIV